jgi:hypothetical protein
VLVSDVAAFGPTLSGAIAVGSGTFSSMPERAASVDWPFQTSFSCLSIAETGGLIAGCLSKPDVYLFYFSIEV